MIRILLAVAFIAVGPSSAVAQETVDAAQDGLVARLTMGDVPTLEWRFEKALPANLSGISATLNGRAVPIASSQQYPQPGDITSALVVLDNTGGAAEPHADVIRTLRARAVGIYGAWTNHRAIALAGTGAGLEVVVPEPGVPFSPVEALVGLGFGDAPSDLHSVISVSIAHLGDIPDSSRRTMFLFTDGHSDTPPDYTALTTEARAAGVSVNVVVEPSREADLSALQAFAVSTGGFYAAGTDARGILATPFHYVDSGGTATFPLTDLRRFFWDEQQELVVTFTYGERTLVLRAPASLPEASLSETAQYVWDNHGRTAGFVLAGAGWAVALLLMPFARIGRRNKIVKAAPPAKEAPAPATMAQPAAAPVAAPATKAKALRLVLTAPGTDYRNDVTLEVDRISIGRARDNVVHIPNDSVSGHHAIIVRSDDGVYSLTNLSQTNPTSVNGLAAQSATLRSGDELGFGVVLARVVL